MHIQFEDIGNTILARGAIIAAYTFEADNYFGIKVHLEGIEDGFNILYRTEVDRNKDMESLAKELCSG